MNIEKRLDIAHKLVMRAAWYISLQLTLKRFNKSECSRAVKKLEEALNELKPLISGHKKGE